MHIYTFDRKVSADFTFRLAGRSYPAPGFEAGQIIVVSPIARTNDVHILGTRESIPNGDGIIVQPIAGDIATHRRPHLTLPQRAELERSACALGICLQQAYVRLRAGSISLSSI